MRRFIPWLALLAAALAVAGAMRSPLWDEDETRFASIARGMLRSGDWVVPRFNGELSDKPPLFFQAAALSFRLLGESASAARFPSLVAAVLGLLATWLIARRLFGREVAAWACLALGTSLLFMAEATLATTDAMLLAFATWTLLPAVATWWDRSGAFRAHALTWPAAVATGVFAGFGILTKGPAALLLPMVTLWLFSWWMRMDGRPPGWRPVSWLADGIRAAGLLRPGFVLAGAVLVALPWHLQVWQQAGGEWFRIFYLHHHAGRLPFLEPLTGVAMQPVASHRGFPFFQVAALLGGMFPWSVFLPLACARILFSAFGRRGAAEGVAATRAAARFVLVWLGVWLLVVSFSSTQLPHYAFPAYPSAAMMVAALLMQAARVPDSMRNGWLYAGAGGLAFGGLVMVVVVAVAARLALLPRSVWLFLPGTLVVAGGAGVFLAVLRRNREAVMGVLAAAALLLAVAVFGLAAPKVGSKNPLPGMIAAADAQAGHPARLAAYRFTLPGLVWESGRTVAYCRSAGELARFLESGPDAAAFVDESALGEIAGVMARHPRVLLSERPLFRNRGAAVLVPP